jgi:hypothetical protein
LKQGHIRLPAATAPPLGEKEAGAPAAVDVAAEERPISSKSRTTSSRDCDCDCGYPGPESAPPTTLLWDDARDCVDEALFDTDIGRESFLPIELDFAEEDTGRDDDVYD